MQQGHPVLRWIVTTPLLRVTISVLFVLANVVGIFISALFQSIPNAFFVYEQVVMWPVLIVGAAFFIAIVLFQVNPSPSTPAGANNNPPAVVGWLDELWKLVLAAVVCLLVVLATFGSLMLVYNQWQIGVDGTKLFFMVVHLLFALGFVFLAWANRD